MSKMGVYGKAPKGSLCGSFSHPKGTPHDDVRIIRCYQNGVEIRMCKSCRVKYGWEK